MVDWAALRAPKPPAANELARVRARAELADVSTKAIFDQMVKLDEAAAQGHLTVQPKSRAEQSFLK